MKTLSGRIALSACLAFAVNSCISDPSRITGGSPLKSTTKSLTGLELLSCEAMAADTAVASIGAAGGTISVGPHTLVIPAGALDSTVEITAIAPSGDVNRVEFSPEGLTFDEPASLTMSYANCGVLSGLIPRHIVYLDDELSIAELLSSIDSFLAQTVTASIEHFSGYAVAW